MYIHIYTHIYVHIYTSQKECLHIFHLHVFLKRSSVLPLAILWMGLRGDREGLPSMLATSFAEAAGVAGRQKWGLVLIQQCTGLPGYISNGRWSEIP